MVEESVLRFADMRAQSFAAQAQEPNVVGSEAAAWRRDHPGCDGSPGSRHTLGILMTDNVGHISNVQSLLWTRQRSHEAKSFSTDRWGSARANVDRESTNLDYRTKKEK